MRPLPYLMCVAVLVVVYSGCGDDTGQGYTPPVQDPSTSPAIIDNARAGGMGDGSAITVEPQFVHIEATFADWAPFTLRNASGADLVVTLAGESPYVEVGCHPYHSGSSAMVDVPIGARDTMDCEVVWYSLGHGDYSGGVSVTWALDGQPAGATTLEVEGVQVD